MNLMKVWRIIALSLDEGISIAQILADGKITKEEFTKFVENLVEIVNNILKEAGASPLPEPIQGQIVRAIVQSKEIYQIVKDYLAFNKKGDEQE